MHRDHRMHPAVEHLEKHLGEPRAHTGASRGERVGAQQKHRPDDVDGEGIAGDRAGAAKRSGRTAPAPTMVRSPTVLAPTRTAADPMRTFRSTIDEWTMAP